MKAKARNIYFKNGSLFVDLEKWAAKEKRSINFLVEEAVTEFLKSKKKAK